MKYDIEFWSTMIIANVYFAQPNSISNILIGIFWFGFAGVIWFIGRDK